MVKNNYRINLYVCRVKINASLHSAVIYLKPKIKASCTYRIGVNTNTIYITHTFLKSVQHNHHNQKSQNILRYKLIISVFCHALY